MTSKQRIAILADWWPRACEVQGWRKDDRPRRLEVIGEAVGRTITSLNDLDNSGDIDKVKARLGTLAENLQSAIEDAPGGDEYGKRRNLYWLIRKHAWTLGGEPYIQALARDRFGVAAGLGHLEDLSTPELHQLMITLNARRRAKTKPTPATAVEPEEDLEPALACDDNQPF